MFDLFLKSKFYTKCKSSIKMTRTRIELKRKKRNAAQKYLRNDVADLLKTGLHRNAYARAARILHELNWSSCYDLIEQFCETISSNLAALDKQRDCPEECKEAAASLMFAAARFADLPDLRELRTIFSDRYGDIHEGFANKEFIQKLKSLPPTRDMKIQLMREIASEAGIEWNPKALERNEDTPTFDQGMGDNFDHDEQKLHERADYTVHVIGSMGADYKHSSANEFNLSSRGIGGENDVLEINKRDDLSSKRTDSINNKERKAYWTIPPPYRISTLNKTGSSKEEGRDDEAPDVHVDMADGHDHKGVEARPKPKSVCRWRSRDANGANERENLKGDKEERSVKNISIGTAERETADRVPIQLDADNANKENTHVHVHPKLLDYDDFIARLAALRGN